jgi:hypothetical protein
MDYCKDLDYDDLCHLIQEYNFYVMNFPEEHDVSYEEYPVSIYEFYENEYQEIRFGED